VLDGKGGANTKIAQLPLPSPLLSIPWLAAAAAAVQIQLLFSLSPSSSSSYFSFSTPQ
jgi:hypothetical protein